MAMSTLRIHDPGTGWRVLDQDGRTVFVGWRPPSLSALTDAGCAMTGLQDCIKFCDQAHTSF